MPLPIHVAQIAWAVSVAGNVYLLTKNFDTGFVKMIADHRCRKKNE
jgi:hypothetical protein